MAASNPAPLIMAQDAEYRPWQEVFSYAEWLIRIARDNLGWFLRRLTATSEAQLDRFVCEWKNWERPGQRAPEGSWKTWLVMAGRGFGKTRMGAEWVRKLARKAGHRIAMIGATMAEVRAIMIEGDSGLLKCSPPEERPVWEPSLGRLRWKNGATAHVYSAAEPDSLRGPQFDAAWCDEIAKWPKGEEVWANLEFTMRLGKNPQIMATTTPRPVPLVKRLVKEGEVAEER